MPASSTLIADAKTMITAGPSAATQTKALNANGPIQDMAGHLQLYLLKLQEANVLLTQMKAATDAGDGNLTYINNALTTLS